LSAAGDRSDAQGRAPSGRRPAAGDPDEPIVIDFDDFDDLALAPVEDEPDPPRPIPASPSSPASARPPAESAPRPGPDPPLSAAPRASPPPVVEVAPAEMPPPPPAQPSFPEPVAAGQDPAGHAPAGCAPAGAEPPPSVAPAAETQLPETPPPETPLPDAPPPAGFGQADWESLLEGLNLGEREAEELAKALDFRLRLGPPARDAQVAVLETDALIAGLDEALSRQLDAILHSPGLMSLERTWRSLKFLTDLVYPGDNVIIHILDARKDEVQLDLVEAPEITRSAMFQKVYSAEYGQFGGQPFGVLIGAWEVGSGPEDLSLMRQMSHLGAMAHAPFVAPVGRSFFGLASWGELPAIGDLDSLLGQPRFAAWAALRASESSRYLALILPGFLARLPYSPSTSPTASFNYVESLVDADGDYVWGFSSLLLGLKMAQSFAKYRWCVNITGTDGGGLIEGLPKLEIESMGRLQNRIPLQAVIGERLEQSLANNGLIPVTLIDSGSKAAIFQAPTVLKPKSLGNDAAGAEASFSHRVSTLLPYMMIINRLAHYIKVIQRENIGGWKDRQVIERELNAWLNQFVTDMDNPSPALRGKRPLRAAKVEVTDLDGFPGWRQMSLQVRPHLKFMGASFTLSLMGRLDEAVPSQG
jgi:type VI secretion system protein ImpC